MRKAFSEEKNVKKIFMLVCILAALGCLAAPVRVAADASANPNPALNEPASDQQPLLGLKQFYVVVENLDQAARDGGLDRDSIKSWIELHLRAQGLPVVTDRPFDADDKDQSRAYLYVNVCVVKGAATSRARL